MTCTRGATSVGNGASDALIGPPKPTPTDRRGSKRSERGAHQDFARGQPIGGLRLTQRSFGPHIDWIESARPRRGAPSAKATYRREDYEDTQFSPYVRTPRDAVRAGSGRPRPAGRGADLPGVGKRRLRGYEGPGRDQALRRERPDRGRQHRHHHRQELHEQRQEHDQEGHVRHQDRDPPEGRVRHQAHGQGPKPRGRRSAGPCREQGGRDEREGKGRSLYLPAAAPDDHRPRRSIWPDRGRHDRHDHRHRLHRRLPRSPSAASTPPASPSSTPRRSRPRRPPTRTCSA